MLRIHWCSSLVELNGCHRHSLTNLERLEIEGCPLLESLGYRSYVDDCSSDDEFPFNSSLRLLRVWSCVKLKTINGAWLRSFTSLLLIALSFWPYQKGFASLSLTELSLGGFKNISRQD
ncbi:hypothetical protein Droror1_Dr00020996 [Drosera rotundifolia]